MAIKIIEKCLTNLFLHFYRVIYAIMYLIVYWTQSLLDILEVTDIALTCIYFILIVNNFQGAEWAYQNMIAEGFGKCEK